MAALVFFPKDWGVNKGYDEGVMLQLSERTHKLRYMKTLFTDIAPHTSWQSAEYILTPHHNGWAEGLFHTLGAKQNIKKLYPMPDHVRDGLGYRSIWMKTSFYAEILKASISPFVIYPKLPKNQRTRVG